MSYLFSLCLSDDVEQGRNRPAVVRSFREIKQMLNMFAKGIGRKFTKYETELVVADSSTKFFKWGDTYRVVGVQSDGSRIPLGYCNFEKSWVNYYSQIDVSMTLIFVFSIIGVVTSMISHNLPACGWAFIAALLTTLVGGLRFGLLQQKLMYLLK